MGEEFTAEARALLHALATWYVSSPGLPAAAIMYEPSRQFLEKAGPGAAVVSEETLCRFCGEPEQAHPGARCLSFMQMLPEEVSGESPAEAPAPPTKGGDPTEIPSMSGLRNPSRHDSVSGSDREQGIPVTRGAPTGPAPEKDAVEILAEVTLLHPRGQRDQLIHDAIASILKEREQAGARLHEYDVRYDSMIHELRAANDRIERVITRLMPCGGMHTPGCQKCDAIRILKGDGESGGTK